MDKAFFDNLIGHKISILVDNITPAGRRESYLGEISESQDSFITLILAQDYDKPNKIIAISIKHSLILSVWIYQ